MIPSSDRNIGVQSSVPSALRRRMRSFLIQKRHQRGGPNLRPRTVSTRRSNTTLLWSQKATAHLWISRSAMTRSEFDRKSVVWGKSVSVRVDLGGSRILEKKNRIQKLVSPSKYQHIIIYNAQ